MLHVEEARRLLRGVVCAGPTISRPDKERRVDPEATAVHMEWMLPRGARRGNTVFIVPGPSLGALV